MIHKGKASGLVETSVILSDQTNGVQKENFRNGS